MNVKKMQYEALEEAQRKKISVFLCLKRKLNYRKADWYKNKCAECKDIFKSPYEENKYNCMKLGLQKDPQAFIEKDHRCDAFKYNL